MFSAGLPDDGLIPPVENPLPLADPGELPMEELTYSFQETSADLYIQDASLTMSYGIFGAPGSGKTFLMMHLLRRSWRSTCTTRGGASARSSSTRRPR